MMWRRLVPRLAWRLYLLLAVALFFIGQELGYYYLGGE